MPRIALATERARPGGHEDDAGLPDALRDAGLEPAWAVWDDPAVQWSRFDLTLVRSVWDYTARRDAFLAWAGRVPNLHNPAAVLRDNTDKRYLAGIPEAVETAFLAPGEPLAPLAREVVVKPTVSAGSRDTGRFAPGDDDAARALLARIHASGRTAMVQPYLRSVDERGETALVLFGGRLSHAVAKGPLLERGAEGAGVTPERLAARDPEPGERALARALADRFDPPLTYMRVDLVRDDEGVARVLELELTEPSLFFAHAAGGEARLAAVVAERVAA
jgi:glutathione synthase/RimK-type ligase-like ATP-grasp enzyme